MKTDRGTEDRARSMALLARLVRTMLMIFENHQQDDGTIAVPSYSGSSCRARGHRAVAGRSRLVGNSP
ncbi:MAG: hypothetical protein R2710_21240 [Acidimicrobiales bacterium]